MMDQANGVISQGMDDDSIGDDQQLGFDGASDDETGIYNYYLYTFLRSLSLITYSSCTEFY